MKRLMKTLYGRISLVLCLILLLSITVIAIHWRTVRQSALEQQIAALRQENAVYAAAMNTSFALLEENLFNLPATNHAFQELARGGDAQDASLEYWARVSNLRQQLATLRTTCPYVESFFVYFPGQDLFLNDMANPEMTLRVRALIANGQGDAPDAWEAAALPSGTYLLRVYAQRGCYLGAWVRCDALAAAFTGGGDGVSLYSAEGAALTAGAPAELTATDGRLLISDLAAHPGVVLARWVSTGDLRAASRFSGASFGMVCALHALLLLFVLLAVSLWVLRPIRALSAGIQRIRGGETSYRLPPAPRDSAEFQEIQREFNAMLDETQQMRIQMYEQKLQQDEVKLRYLSQQIQPHFILNSLNMLYAHIGRENEIARRIIRLLAQYYRYIINIESQYVEIGQEMDHLENYLAFQKVRYAERLSYAIACDPAVRQVPIPPLLLESFVGNALKYGQDAQDSIEIQVTAQRPEPDTVRICVADHGSGFPGEILDALRGYQITGERDELLGVGICNSLDRLQLIYGDAAAIHFYNAEDHGAVVEIRIHQADENHPEATTP